MHTAAGIIIADFVSRFNSLQSAPAG